MDIKRNLFSSTSSICCERETPKVSKESPLIQSIVQAASVKMENLSILHPQNLFRFLWVAVVLGLNSGNTTRSYCLSF